MRTRPIQVSSDPVSPDPSTKIEAGRKFLEHRTVLLHEAIELLDIRDDDTVVDATLGGAGHARAIAQKLGPSGTLLGFDLDHDAIERAQNALRDARCRVEFFEQNFRTLGSALQARSVREINSALFDLGWSSFQLEAERGFSFNTNDPLVMTYSKAPPNGLTAARIVNHWGESSLADIIYGWGEERYSRRIARALVERRQVKEFTIAKELADTIYAAVPAGYRRGRIHPATKTFQALRIAVNDELGALKEGLSGAWALLKPGGRIAVITFHSIEDRQVKLYFAALEKNGTGKRLTKKPLSTTAQEIAANPRSRSAKLRVIQKLG